jgi:hypothetical protein
LHEVAAGFIPGLSPSEPPAERITRVVITKIEKRPTPKPSPTPRITPPPAHVLAPVATKVLPNPGQAGAPRPKPHTKYHSKPIWDILPGGQGAGSGRSGKGTGAGGVGHGIGGGGTEPCGYVTFSPGGAPAQTATGIIYNGVRMAVHFPDGHAETLVLDYPWHYRTTGADPFKNESVPMLFQYPPAGLRYSQPALVQYVMTHSTGGGFTKLNDCPS